jgi:hypothetical protein
MRGRYGFGVASLKGLEAGYKEIGRGFKFSGSMTLTCLFAEKES